MSTLKITKDRYAFEKIGMEEIEGLTKGMVKLMIPVKEHLKQAVYWNDLALRKSEYKSRDGFIPYSSNCGGIELQVIVPKCEEYSFPFLDFEECDECTAEKQCGYDGQECAGDYDGHFDSNLRIWLKFEGLENGRMSFYLYCGGGNNDAPYFRTKFEPTLFEDSFTARSLPELERVASKRIAKLIKFLKVR